MNVFLFLWQSTPPGIEVSAEVWEIIKGVMLALSTMAVTGLLALAWKMRDAVRDLMKEIGMDGRNGLKARASDHEHRIKELEKWRIGEEAVTEIERELMQDTGRRPSRLRDKLHGEDS